MFPVCLQFDGAVKYILLNQFGERATGQVVAIDDQWHFEGYEKDIRVLRNSAAGDKITIMFAPESGSAIVGHAIVSDAKDSVALGDTIDVLYISSRPKIILPEFLMPAFRIDVEIAGFGSAVLLDAMISLVVIYRRWRRFLRIKQEKFG